MAELIDIEETAEEDFSDLPEKVEPVKALEEETKELTEQAAEIHEDNSEEIPEKYRNKTVKELVDMHQNAEKAIGKQGGEVGELRKMVDDYIQAQVPEQPKEQEQQNEDIDFFTAPEKAVETAIDRHPAIKAAKKATEDMQLETARNHIITKHPNIRETLTDPKFAEWVKGSQYRQKQFIQAETRFDLDAVDELMTGWSERQSFVDNTVATEKNARKDSVREASTGSTQSSQGGSRKPIFRRADIIKLITNDPDRYEALYPEIAQAYIDGRVK